MNEAETRAELIDPKLKEDEEKFVLRPHWDSPAVAAQSHSPGCVFDAGLEGFLERWETDPVRASVCAPAAPEGDQKAPRASLND